MTIIVGYKFKDKVIIGADSQGTRGYNKTIRKDPKVFVSHGIAYGFCGSYRMGQILRFHSQEILSALREKDPYEYVVKELIPMWRKILKDNGYAKINNNIESGGYFIIGIDEHLFNISYDFQVGISNKNYVVAGCGEDFALGALYCLENSGLDVKEKIIRAIEAAMEFNAGCGGAMDFVEIESKDLNRSQSNKTPTIPLPEKETKGY